MRAKASSSSKKKGSLKKGDVVSSTSITKADGYNWAYVKSGSLTGWVRMDYLTVTSAPKNTGLGQVKTSKSNIKIRAGAGTSYSKVGVAPANTALTYYNTAKKNGVTWYYVQYGSKYGWVSGAYFSIVKATATPKPTATPKTSALTVQGYGINTGNVQFRKGAGTGYASMGKIPSGKTLPWYKTAKNGKTTWYYVKYNDKYGWVSGAYFAKTKNSSTTSTTSTKTDGSYIVKKSGSYTMNIYKA